MENQNRDLETETRPRNVKGRDSRLSDLTIMIVGKVGKFHSFKISSRIFLLAALFLIIYIAVSLFVFDLYFHERRMNIENSKEMGSLQEEIESVKSELHKSRQHLALLRETIYELKASREETAATEQPEENIYESPEKSPAEEEKDSAPEISVEISDLAFFKKEDALTVEFNLVNMLDEDKPASGYVHIIAINRETNPHRVWAYPRCRLLNELPVDYKRGQRFYIKRFKAIKGVYPLENQDITPSSIKVLVYDPSGSIIFQKEFEVKNASR